METSKLLPWVWLEAQYNYKVLLSLEHITRTFMTRHRRKLLCVRSKSCVSDEVWPHMEFDSRFRKCIMFTARCCGCLEQIFKFFNALMLIILPVGHCNLSKSKYTCSYSWIYTNIYGCSHCAIHICLYNQAEQTQSFYLLIDLIISTFIQHENQPWWGSGKILLVGYVNDIPLALFLYVLISKWFHQDPDE